MEHMMVEDFCVPQVMFQIGIPPVRIDFLTSVGDLDFGRCWERRAKAPIGGSAVPMLGLSDLIEAKEAAGREQDLIDLAKLRKMRDNREGAD